MAMMKFFQHAPNVDPGLLPEDKGKNVVLIRDAPGDMGMLALGKLRDFAVRREYNSRNDRIWKPSLLIANIWYELDVGDTVFVYQKGDLSPSESSDLTDILTRLVTGVSGPAQQEVDQTISSIMSAYQGL